jgi:hypothetical protein
VAAQADATTQRWNVFIEDWPLRQAWARDTIGMILTSRKRSMSSRKRNSRLALGASIAATILLGLIGFSLLRWQQDAAHSTIASNTKPLPDPVAVSPPDDAPLAENPDRDSDDSRVGQLADTEPLRASETPVSASDAVPVSKSLSRTRFGFDLEHGVPMPYDTREAKPVY